VTDTKKNGNQKNGHKPVGAVMVVGGGISGMQSAIDLVESGYKVYMVEETSAIGGRMAQLDKTFPTNDCSMCLISPKLIEVAKDLNIDLITNAEVKAIKGEEGNFTVDVLKKPRYIDEEKCTACGDCVKACPVDLLDEFNQGLSKRQAAHKRYPQAVPNIMAISKTNRPPCKLSCPAECNGQGYVALISKGKYEEALNHIKQWLPIPATLGRICHHPCELNCNRSDVDEPIGIRPLKRFVTDIVREKRQAGELPPEEKLEIDPDKPKVAVVGSGPAGLSCALDLARLGYPVTIFEANAHAGGALYYSIPSYRLPKDKLEEDIQEILDAGIDIKYSTRIGKDVTLDQLKEQGYKAVFLGIGAEKSKTLNIEGNDLKGAVNAIELLKDVAEGTMDRPGDRVIVVGGGNVAMDVARTCIRLGVNEVNVVYRRSRTEMPALADEVDEAEEEGVNFTLLTNPSRILGKDGRVTGLEVTKMELGEPDESGRRRPVAIEGSEYVIPTDAVIMAVGEETELDLFTGDHAAIAGKGLINADPVTLQTPVKGVFAGGDAVTGPKSAVEAVQQGHDAATSIDRYFKGEDLAAGRPGPAQEPAPTPEGEWEKEPRVAKRTIPMDERRTTFKEVEIGYTEEEAREETSRCLDCGLCSECLECVAACPANAVNHDEKPENLSLSVGSIILSMGIEPVPGELKEEYGYGRYPNVVTSLEFERILSASGPTLGQVTRPSDGEHPVKIAWIQCVGSRDESCGRGYCSSVCCMYATKESIIAKEHDGTIQPTIFYNDIRAFGKGFERYYEAAREKNGVRYVKSIPSTVKEITQNHNLVLEFVGDDGRKTSEEFDLVVLSVGIQPSKNGRATAEALGVELDEYGFCETDEFHPNATSRPGIFVSGAFETPMDIPESVMSGSSASCLASANVAAARRTMLTEKEYPEELPVEGEEPRVGVFICRCGANIARVVDVPELTDYAKTLPYVVHAEENIYTCSTDTQNKIVDAVKEHNLNRVVVASCSPRTHEVLFQDTIREAGLNKYLFDMANIRDQDSWVHFSLHDAANDKAKDLVRMAVARATTLKPLSQSPIDLKHNALIIGGGLAGLTAALALADNGFESIIVEKENELGGNLRRIHATETGKDVDEFLNDLLARVEKEPKITVHTGADLKKMSGFQGNYVSEVEVGGETKTVEHGVVIMATGGTEHKPTEYLYGESPNVVTQLELEDRIAAGRHKDVKSVAMIQCVGSREGENMYCSRVCCTQAVKNAIKIKTDNPEADVAIMYRDIRTYGKYERFYRKAREMGVSFIRFDVENKPQVTQDGDRLKVVVHDTALHTDIELNPDQLVLSAAIRPQPDAKEMASRLKLPLTQDGFCLEAHVKLRPLDFANEGMYLCGLAHSPKNITESIQQAQGAVSRAMTVLSQPSLMAGGVVSVVDQEQCVGCLTCVRSCPFNVPRINEEGVATIEAAACQGCGICAAACPRKAIHLQHYEDEQILAKTAVLQE
jgi:heterodisulfide reductase subunit A-like polyferredoxin